MGYKKINIDKSINSITKDPSKLEKNKIFISIFALLITFLGLSFGILTFFTNILPNGRIWVWFVFTLVFGGLLLLLSLIFDKSSKIINISLLIVLVFHACFGIYMASRLLSLSDAEFLIRKNTDVFETIQLIEEGEELTINDDVKEPSITYTPTATSTTTSTPTPTLTPTLTPTITTKATSEYSSISIGLIDLENDCWDKKSLERKDKEIFDRLSILGFTVDLIDVASGYDILKKYDVVYLPYGWYCQMDSIKTRATYYQEYTKFGGGLLIGNPDIKRPEFKFTIFQTDFTYKYNPNVSDDYPSEIVPGNSSKPIVENFIDPDMPVPENSLEFNGFYDSYLIAKGRTSNAYSLVIFDPYKDGRAVVITGGELSESGHQISEQVLTRIILWLSKKYN